MSLYEQSLFELIKMRLQPGFIDDWLQQQRPLLLQNYYFIIYESLESLANRVCHLHKESFQTRRLNSMEVVSLGKEFHDMLQTTSSGESLDKENEVYVIVCTRRNARMVIPICLYQVEV